MKLKQMFINALHEDQEWAINKVPEFLSSDLREQAYRIFSMYWTNQELTRGEMEAAALVRIRFDGLRHRYNECNSVCFYCRMELRPKTDA